MLKNVKKRVAMSFLPGIIQTPFARIPSMFFLSGAMTSIFLSLLLFLKGKKHESLFIGQWAPTLLLLGIYHKLLRLAGL